MKAILKVAATVSILMILPLVGAFQPSSSSLASRSSSWHSSYSFRKPDSHHRHWQLQSSAAEWYQGSTKNDPRLLEEITGRIIDGAPVSIVNNNSEASASQEENVDEASSSSSTTTTTDRSQNKPNGLSTAESNDESALKFRYAAHDLSLAAVVGLVSGLLIALFKFSIEGVRRGFYGQTVWEYSPALMAAVPAVGGLIVGLLMLLGKFSLGLRGTVEQVDEAAGRLQVTPKMGPLKILKRQLESLRKTIAAVFTLGTGCSLGPEGPCVEIGMSVARACMDATTPDSFVQTARQRQGWNRRLLACGAAAGVAAGFNAPVAGVFFALEVMGNTFSAVTNDNVAKQAAAAASGTAFSDDNANLKELSATERISPILVSSVCAALAARTLLGEHFVLQLSAYSLKNPLLELPLYMLLGVISGGVAFSFSEGAKLSQGFFGGKVGSQGVQTFMRKVPNWVKPVVGGLFCGLVGLMFPQILFFGYETLNSLLAKSALPAALIVSLLFVKMTTTAVSAGSGLIGGTFAPALFLGAMTGAAFHSGFSWLFESALHLQLHFAGLPGMADLPAYTMIGSASVLAALFRAPLTASMVLFELTRDYDVILPLMVSAGLGSLVGDILDNKFEQAKRRRDKDSVSWGDLASNDKEEEDQTITEPPIAANKVNGEAVVVSGKDNVSQ